MARAALSGGVDFLAVANKKVGDEEEVLETYRSASGRSRVLKRVIGNLTSPTATHFQNALHVLSYWRDDAGHGEFTTITEIEAHTALSQLLRLAQFSTDNWEKLMV